MSEIRVYRIISPDECYMRIPCTGCMNIIEIMQIVAKKVGHNKFQLFRDLTTQDISMTELEGMCCCTLDEKRLFLKISPFVVRVIDGLDVTLATDTLRPTSSVKDLRVFIERSIGHGSFYMYHDGSLIEKDYGEIIEKDHIEIIENNPTEPTLDQYATQDFTIIMIKPCVKVIVKIVESFAVVDTFHVLRSDTIGFIMQHIAKKLKGKETTMEFALFNGKKQIGAKYGTGYDDTKVDWFFPRKDYDGELLIEFTEKVVCETVTVKVYHQEKYECYALKSNCSVVDLRNVIEKRIGHSDFILFNHGTHCETQAIKDFMSHNFTLKLLRRNVKAEVTFEENTFSFDHIESRFDHIESLSDLKSKIQNAIDVDSFFIFLGNRDLTNYEDDLVLLLPLYGERKLCFNVIRADFVVCVYNPCNDDMFNSHDDNKIIDTKEFSKTSSIVSLHKKVRKYLNGASDFVLDYYDTINGRSSVVPFDVDTLSCTNPNFIVRWINNEIVVRYRRAPIFSTSAFSRSDKIIDLYNAMVKEIGHDNICLNNGKYAIFGSKGVGLFPGAEDTCISSYPTDSFFILLSVKQELFTDDMLKEIVKTK